MESNVVGTPSDCQSKLIIHGNNAPESNDIPNAELFVVIVDNNDCEYHGCLHQT